MPYGAVLDLSLQKEPHEDHFSGNTFNQFGIIKIFDGGKYNGGPADAV